MEANVTPPTTPEHQGRIVADYRRRQHWTQQQLADALHVEGRTVQRMEGQIVIKNVQRRRLLVGLLGIPAALMGLEAEQRAADQARVIPINQDRMSFLEDELAARWELYYTGGTARAARSLPTWTHEIAKFASAARGTPWHAVATTRLHAPGRELPAPELPLSRPVAVCGRPLGLSAGRADCPGAR